MNYIFIGIQGSGKGTQARLLEEKFDFKLFESGTALRNISKEDSELGKIVKNNIEQGNHIMPSVIEDIMTDIIDNKSEGKNSIFDGFVRNSGNKKSADKVLGNYKVVLFELSEKKSKERLLGRMYNPETSETFPAGIKFDPETGKKLEKRADDNEKAILKRINLYIEKTIPVIEEYRKNGNIIEINADQSVIDVYSELVEKLKLKK